MPAGPVIQDRNDPIRYLENPIWHQPKWPLTLAELKYVGSYGPFNRNNHCLHSAQRMARAMGWLDEVQRLVREW
ncbi:hypothetical protein AAVH_35294, partial [Aphelenchoides avenae]